MSRSILEIGDECISASGKEYIIERHLGQGAIGVVYLCKDSTGRKLALKILSPDIRFLVEESLIENVRARFLRESSKAMRISGEHIIQVVDSGLKGDNPFLVMEYIEGGSLKESSSSSLAGKSYVELLILCKQVAQGVKEVHEANCIHRDIKPANILFDETSDLAKLSDFGIVKWSDLLLSVSSKTLTSTKDHLGTFFYMSPEQKRNPSTVTHKSDIYSLGVTFYEILTGMLPLPEAIAIGDMLSISSRYNCNGEIDRLIKNMIAYLPEKRSDSVEIIQDLSLIINCEKKLVEIGKSKSDKLFSEFACEDCGSHLCRSELWYSHNEGTEEVDIERLYCLDCGKWNRRYDEEVRL